MTKTRRTFLTGAAIACTGFALAILPDPIHAAIDAHRTACAAADLAAADCSLNVTPGLRTLEEQAPIADAAFVAFIAEREAARALDGTASTVAGLQALEAHRRVERHRRRAG